MTQPIARSYKQHPPEGQFDAIVIGSGIGGLAAAAILAKHAGKRPLVLERHYVPGGYTHVFQRPGYEWDVGLHYIGQVDDPQAEARRLFDYVTDGKLAWARMPEVYEGLVIGDRTFDLPAGREHWRHALVGYFPDAAAAIDRYLETVGACVRASRGYYVEKVIPRPIAAIVGPLLRARFLRYARRTTLETLREITRDPALIAALTGQYGDYGLPPAQSSFAVHATVVEHYLEGAAYPVGGAGRIAASILPLIEAAGGAVRVSAEVQQILIEGGRAVGVRMADGRDLRAPTIISDAGAFNTFCRLLPRDAAERTGLPDRIRRIPPSPAHCCLYVGLKQTDRELGLTGTNLWIHRDADHDGNFARFLQDPAAPFPAVYISFPSAKDPSFQDRFPGRATIEVVVKAPYEWFEPWANMRWRQRDPAYEEFKARLAGRLLEQLYRHVPQVRGAVDYSELSTPLSTRHFTGYARGEMYGLSHTPERFRMRLGSQTRLRGLFLTGQDLAMLGVVGALSGGAMAASAVLRRNILRAILHGSPESVPPTPGPRECNSVDSQTVC
jgi:all-trans-retinol 13,14-reductase